MTTTKPFRFELGDRVAIGSTGERGEVFARQQRVGCENRYGVLCDRPFYDWRPVEEWCGEHDLAKLD